jgi:YebC/PmpR family DNA-binding regulatory protein
MAGHSKWKNIRLHKGKADLERGKVFGRLSREITIAARMGGGLPESNPRLRLAIDKARESSMPADNIKRAVQKGTGELAGENAIEEVSYEGYGPGGAAVFVEAATDNRNRTVSEVRAAFNKNGGSMGESGSVAWQFARKGVIAIDAQGAPAEDELMEIALEAGAEDFSSGGDSYEVTTSPEELASVADALKARGIAYASADVQMVPQNTVQLEGENARRMLKLMDVLEDLDDVQRVAANFDIAESELQASAA